jgi:hypothetical protein
LVTPINLNKARKARARADKQQRAAENRVKFGRTKVEKERDRRAEERATIQLDQSKRND